jgi:hypothetical protein
MHGAAWCCACWREGCTVLLRAAALSAGTLHAFYLCYVGTAACSWQCLLCTLFSFAQSTGARRGYGVKGRDSRMVLWCMLGGHPVLMRAAALPAATAAPCRTHSIRLAFRLPSGVLLWCMLESLRRRAQLHTFQQALQQRADALSCVLSSSAFVV